MTEVSEVAPEVVPEVKAEKTPDVTMADLEKKLGELTASYNEAYEALKDSDLESKHKESSIITEHVKLFKCATGPVDVASYAESCSTMAEFVENKCAAAYKQAYAFRCLEKLRVSEIQYLGIVIQSLREKVAELTPEGTKTEVVPSSSA